MRLLRDYPGEAAFTPRTALVKTIAFRSAPLNRVMEIGRFGRWRLNQKFVRRAGFEGIYPYKDNARTSCRTASRIDTYFDGVSLAWIDGVLAAVRTTFGGDRSKEGFVIGTTDLSTVRARYPALRVIRGGPNDWRLVAVAEGMVELRWFDLKGILVALETSIRRC